MPFSYRFSDYERYRSRVGAATYVDITRRGDPARIVKPWRNLEEILSRAGPPWVVQVWTKDPAGALVLGGDTIDALRAAGTTLTAQVTITGLAGTQWEPLVPTRALDALPELAARLGGADHVTWRYDPIIPSVHTTQRFGALAMAIAEIGVRRGVVNFVAPPGRYRRVDARMAPLLPGWDAGMRAFDGRWRRETLSELVALAKPVGLALATCAEYASLSDDVLGLSPPACGDYDWFSVLSGRDPGRVAYHGSRPGCGCAPYFDVGHYGTWKRCHRCAYCYAG